MAAAGLSLSKITDLGMRPVFKKINIFDQPSIFGLCHHGRMQGAQDKWSETYERACAQVKRNRR